MRLLAAQVKNYKSFADSSELRFSAGLNVIVGPNNVGKTALLEALSLRFGNVPHRSLETLPTRSAPHSQVSEVNFTFEIDPAELRMLARDSFPSFYIPAFGAGNIDADIEEVRRFFANPIAVSCVYNASTGVTSTAIVGRPASESSNPCLEFRVDSLASTLSPAQRNYVGGIGVKDRLPHKLAQKFQERVYAFRAERMKIGESAMGTDPTLSPDASNLPQVLNLLQSGNPSRFKRFQTYVRDVFPQIQQITVPPVGGAVRILLWSIDPDIERDDLAISLAESGTGIGQVMAMLYIVLTSDYPRMILIDEPHSFLHPAAIRKLLEILFSHREHQYIITTHSPTALASSNPSVLVLLGMEAAKTVAKQIDPRAATEMRVVLAEVGARLSDVFGADSVLWVEGRTEELSFAVIRAKARGAEDKASGAVILGVRSTGEFHRRHAAATLDVYRRLTSGPSLMPPAVGFIFDSEGLSEQDKDDLTRQSGGLVRFLPRRMYENYLLQPGAIAYVMNSIDGFRAIPVSAQEVSDRLAQRKWNRSYLADPVSEESKTDTSWLSLVDGAKVLQDLFKELSEGRVAYDKVAYGVKLTEWLCENDFDRFDEVATLIRNAIAGDGAEG